MLYSTADDEEDTVDNDRLLTFNETALPEEIVLIEGGGGVSSDLILETFRESFRSYINNPDNWEKINEPIPGMRLISDPGLDDLPQYSDRRVYRHKVLNELELGHQTELSSMLGNFLTITQQDIELNY